MKKKHSKSKKAGSPRKAPKNAASARKPRERDPRLPAAETTLTRTYKGKDHRVAVLEDGFRYDGKE